MMVKICTTVCSLVLLFIVAGQGSQAAAKEKPHKVKVVQTEWTVVSGVPQVAHTVSGGKDVFRYQNRYYCYDGRWLEAHRVGGPWIAVPAPPPVIYRVDTVYFKNTPPGWCRGKKTGWRGAPLPPGQMKKFP
jgi:hypothetical protein